MASMTPLIEASGSPVDDDEDDSTQNSDSSSYKTSSLHVPGFIRRFIVGDRKEIHINTKTGDDHGKTCGEFVNISGRKDRGTKKRNRSLMGRRSGLSSSTSSSCEASSDRSSDARTEISSTDTTCVTAPHVNGHSGFHGIQATRKDSNKFLARHCANLKTSNTQVGSGVMTSCSSLPEMRETTVFCGSNFQVLTEGQKVKGVGSASTHSGSSISSSRFSKELAKSCGTFLREMSHKQRPNRQCISCKATETLRNDSEGESVIFRCSHCGNGKCRICSLAISEELFTKTIQLCIEHARSTVECELKRCMRTCSSRTMSDGDLPSANAHKGNKTSTGGQRTGIKKRKARQLERGDTSGGSQSERSLNQEKQAEALAARLSPSDLQTAYSQMRTTLAVAYLDESTSRLFVATIGDSKVVLVRGNVVVFESLSQYVDFCQPVTIPFAHGRPSAFASHGKSSNKQTSNKFEEEGTRQGNTRVAAMSSDKENVAQRGERKMPSRCTKDITSSRTPSTEQIPESGRTSDFFPIRTEVVPVLPGDIILTFSAGVVDNLYTEQLCNELREAVNEVGRTLPSSFAPTNRAELLLRLVASASMNVKNESVTTDQRLSRHSHSSSSSSCDANKDVEKDGREVRRRATALSNVALGSTGCVGPSSASSSTVAVFSPPACPLPLRDLKTGQISPAKGVEGALNFEADDGSRASSQSTPTASDWHRGRVHGFTSPPSTLGRRLSRYRKSFFGRRENVSEEEASIAQSPSEPTPVQSKALLSQIVQLMGVKVIQEAKRMMVEDTNFRKPVSMRAASQLRWQQEQRERARAMERRRRRECKSFFHTSASGDDGDCGSPLTTCRAQVMAELAGKEYQAAPGTLLDREEFLCRSTGPRRPAGKKAGPGQYKRSTCMLSSMGGLSIGRKGSSRQESGSATRSDRVPEVVPMECSGPCPKLWRCAHSYGGRLSDLAICISLVLPKPSR